MRTRISPPIHPGEVLREEFLAPLGMSAGALARKLKIPRTRIERIVAQTHPVTTDTALRLSRFFDTTPEFWMAMQTSFDLAIASASMGDELAAIEVMHSAAA